jgi:diaminopimelate decarboxylase
MTTTRAKISTLTAGLKTPFYLYDLDGIRARAATFMAALPAGSHCHFALKANNHPRVLDVMREAGFGVDVVSSGEMQLALKHGFLPKDIIFSGVGKTADEIRLALKNDIDQLNVESLAELERIVHIASELKVKARVALRMNPDVDVNTHPYIRTGFRDNKFGIDFGVIPEILKVITSAKAHVELQGLTLHIGSQIRDVEPFHLAIRKTLDLYRELKASGLNLKTFDVGGGLGIDYLSDDLKSDDKTIADYGHVLQTAFAAELKSKHVERLYLEPGRILVARFGYLVSEVQYVKRTPYKNFAIVDTGMHQLIRPALYEAHHRIELLAAKTASPEVFDVVGPICESSDVLGFERLLPADIKSGDRLVIYDVGAYGAVMASDYNLRERVNQYTFENGALKK